MAMSIELNGEIIYSTDATVDSQIIGPKLIVEANKTGTFEFTVLPGDPHYNDYERLKTVLVVYEDDDVVFRGRVLTISTDFYLQKQISCEGDISFLLDSVMEPLKESLTISAFLTRVIDNHNNQMTNSNSFKKFNVGRITVPANDGDTREFEISSYEETNSVLESCLLDKYGGILITRYDNGEAYIDYLADPSQSINDYSENPQQIEFGVNLLEIEAEPPVDDIFTVLLPTGKDNLTIDDAQHASKLLVHDASASKYGRIVRTESFSDISDKAQLRAVATEFLNTHAAIYPDDLIIKAIDLHLFNPTENRSFRLYDKIRCYSEPHGINIVLVCLQIEYDFVNPENNSYRIGSYIPSDEYTKERANRKAGISAKSASNTKSSKKNTRATAQIKNDVDKADEELDGIINNTTAQIGEEVIPLITNDGSPANLTQAILKLFTE